MLPTRHAQIRAAGENAENACGDRYPAFAARGDFRHSSSPNPEPDRQGTATCQFAAAAKNSCASHLIIDSSFSLTHIHRQIIIVIG